eukprot:CAMPEP_0202074846 /NCGR_PEP_ID=MMETSP0964-20121228/3864_1 /ASSEMBLY_ACC=CAM_ASM_000500 /TAXON_ID=4773 /ORGANISM="Schizochytrium aggregatum, Strain ATCC28209" /LENGTH=332 /DNA_ID=CAMNT_0048642017 /DNA_START=55 /DNA_END=1053 /DNA_ORIENTATION=-
MTKKALIEHFFAKSPTAGNARKRAAGALSDAAANAAVPLSTKASSSASKKLRTEAPEQEAHQVSTEMEIAAAQAEHSAAAEAAQAADAADSAATKPKPKPKPAGPELRMEPGWRAHLQPEAAKPYFTKLDNFLNVEFANKTIYPPRNLVFNAFDLCPFEGTKVVILGQDPYHGAGQAHGLAFSVMAKIAPPPSLRNIFKEVVACGGTVANPKTNGSLEPWAKQGVLLLNSVLTVRASQAYSHKKQGWEEFTDRVIRILNKEKSGLVFLLWGKPAQDKASFVDRSKHKVITSSHPSPLAATKTNEPFIGSKCFKRANDYLVETGREPIDWSLN